MRSAPLTRYSRPVGSVFSLLGENERAITDSLAWVLSVSPAFRSALLKKLTGTHPTGQEFEVATQTAGKDAGFTDIEINGRTSRHLVIEAKRGWQLPSIGQLRRYARRLIERRTVKKHALLVSASECSQTYAKLHLPQRVLGVPVTHISWPSLLEVAKRSHTNASGAHEKQWLRELVSFLQGIASMQDVMSNKVFVVALNTQEIHKGSGYTWADVVTRDHQYFHPVGDTWPMSPPNYIAFRYEGRLQSIHHIEGYHVSSQLRKDNRKWPFTHRPHFVYKLGPSIRPQFEMRTGALYMNARVWCLIDTLLSGKYRTIREARDASQKRLKQAQPD